MNYKKIIVSFFSLAAFIACSKMNDSFENKAFINAENLKNEVRVATDEGVIAMTKSITVGIAQPEQRDINVSVKKSPELLDTYRTAYYHQDVELLPEENCNVEGLSAKIKAGDVMSDDLSIVFDGLDKLDYTKQYVLPITVSADGINILDRAKTMYFVIKEASLVNFVADMKSNRAWPIWDNWEKVANLEQLTMECLVNCRAFNNESDILTIMGVEDHFLVRVGDVNIPTNQIQVALAYKDVEGNSTHRVSVSNAAMQLRKDTWYHLAVTFNKGLVQVYINGRLRAEEDHRVLGKLTDDQGNVKDIIFESVNFSAPHSDESDGKPRCFWIGYSYDDKRSLDGMIAEARLWNRVLTAEEINAPNHFYKLLPSDIDETLLAYWKFCEGEGKVVKDYSIYGKDLEGDHNFVWYPVELPK